jgi:DNA-binding LytR/AlgR family response regulator
LTNGRSEHANLPLIDLENKLSHENFIMINESVIINSAFVESVDKRSRCVTVTDVLQKFEFKASAEGLRKLLNHPMVK